MRVKGTRRALAMAVDGNGRYCWLDPYEGARLAVAEACRNVAAAGGVPIGATNCLNFGNPERPEVMGQLVRAIAGIGEACRALGRAHHRRQRLALQRDRRPRDLPDAGDRRGRPARGRGARPAAGRSAPRATSSTCWATTGDDLGGSEMPEGRARPRGRPAAAARPRGREAAARAPGRGGGPRRPAAPRTTSATAAWRWRLAECCFAGEEPGRGGRFDLPGGPAAGRAALLGDAVARDRHHARRPAHRRAGAPPRRALGAPGRGRRRPPGARRPAARALVDLAVADLHEAWMSLERLLEQR